jgi:elongation factor 1 alpha-like protein
MYVAAREQEKARKRLEQSQSAVALRTASPAPKSKKGPAAKSMTGTSTPTKSAVKYAPSTPTRGLGVDQRTLDLSGLNLTEDDRSAIFEEAPKTSFARDKLLEEAKKVIDSEGTDRKKEVSLVVIGKLFVSR